MSGASGAAARSGYVTFAETAPRSGASFVYRTSTGTTGSFAEFNLDATAGRADTPISATYSVTTVDDACNQTTRPAYTVADSK